MIALIRKVLRRVLGLWDRLFCCFGCHAFGYSHAHGEVLCFQCGLRKVDRE